MYGCWEQTEASEAGFIRWNPAGLSEVTPKSDEVLRMTKDGSFDVYGGDRRMIYAKWSIEGGKIAIDLRNLKLDYTIEADTLTITALDKKKTVYRKLTSEEEAAFLERAGISDASPDTPNRVP